MPRKVTAPKAVAEESAPAEGTRRSSRIAEKPISAAAKPAAPAKKAPASKAKRTAEKDVEDEDAEPAAKKAKPASKAESATVAAPATDAAEGSTTKPASKAAAAKPASTTKPASTSKAASKKATRNVEPAIAEEDHPVGNDKTEVEDKEKENKMEVDEKENKTDAENKEDKTEAEIKDKAGAEDKENQKDEVKATAAEAEAEVGELQIGDTLPDWIFMNEKNEEVEIAKLAGEKGLVLFLIPKADTPGCNTQACAFRDTHEEFEEYGYAVYALSNDTPTAQAKWQTKRNLPYSLLSDPKRKLIHALGAKNGSTTKRSHLVFEKGSGKLVEKKIGVKPAESNKQALEFIKKHHPEEQQS